MSYDIVGCNIAELFRETCVALSNEPVTDSRNGKVRRLTNIELNLLDPRYRHLGIKGRNNNIIAVIAETLWVMSGSNTISPFLDFFLPRAKDYSDDGSTWRGGYGPRIYFGSQIDDISKHIKEEGVETRRNVLGIWNSIFDSSMASGDTKDIPCNSMIWFWVENDSLQCKAQSRSGDVLWGLLNINVFEWTVLMELVRCLIRNNTGIDLGLGSYYHGCIDAHLYEEKSAQAVEVIKQWEGPGEELPTNYIDIGPNIKSQDQLRAFFSSIVSKLAEVINLPEANAGVFYDYLNHLSDIFRSYEISSFNNLLFDYCQVVLYYIMLKRHSVDMGGYFHEVLSRDLNRALKYCKFIDWRN